MKSLIKSTFLKTNTLELLLIIIGLLLTFSAARKSADYFIYDLTLNIADIQSENHVTMVLIDDNSISQLGHWPWSRSMHAKLLRQLSNYSVPVIGFDLMFSEKSQYGDGDAQLSQAIEAAGNVVLPIAPSYGTEHNLQELLPLTIFAQNAAGLGHVDFEIDADGSIRQVYLYAGYHDARWPSFALAMAKVYEPTTFHKRPQLLKGEGWIRDNPKLINYHGAAQGITAVSYVDVLNGSVDPKLLYGKAIIVGVDATALGDRYITPVVASHETMTGIEINAYHLNDVLNQNWIKTIGEIHVCTISIFLLLISAVWMYKASLNNQFKLLSGLIALDLLVCYGLFVWFNLWFPPALIIGGQISIYALFNILKSQNLTNQVASLHHKMVHDRVTGLSNEAGLIDYITQHATSPNLDGFQLFSIRLSNFKGINDLLGSDAGDELLNLAKSRIQSNLTNIKFMARFHGAEFSVCLPPNHDLESTQTLGHSLINTLQQPFIVNGEHFRLPVSIGVASFPQDSTKVKSLLQAAQIALNRAQENFDSGLCIYSHDIKLNLKERAKLESDLAQALNRGEIEVYYQPQVSAEDGKLIGAEALARWNHPERGLVSPDTFIPIAESTGLIIDIGNWILNQACLFAKHIQNEGNQNFRIAVNLSSVQFAKSSLVDEVKSALANSTLEPHLLELELTESCVVGDINSAIDTLNQLKGLGVGLSIDDFGTGYSSLSYLKHFPMDRIKIDRSFVNEINNSKNAQDIALAIISMAHSLDMKVIAEGIENQQQQAFLSEHKVQELQGFYFGKPLKKAQLEQLLGINNGDI